MKENMEYLKLTLYSSASGKSLRAKRSASDCGCFEANRPELPKSGQSEKRGHRMRTGDAGSHRHGESRQGSD